MVAVASLTSYAGGRPHNDIEHTLKGVFISTLGLDRAIYHGKHRVAAVGKGS